MIVDDKKDPPSQTELSIHNAPSSSQRGESSETEHLLVDIGDPTVIPDDPPPEFTPYSPEFFLDNRDDVVSHDPHLNTDGEALYRFLLSQSRVLPTLRVSFRGTHDETRLRWVNSTDAHGHTTTRSEYYTDKITDFDFCIDIHPDHLRTPGDINRAQDDAGSMPTHWSVGDDEPAFRGRMIREVEAPKLDSLSQSSGLLLGRRKKATRQEVGRYLEWVRKRQQMGYPPWLREVEGVDVDLSIRSFDDNPQSLRSSKTVRQWADEYCASPKYLKEFVFQKVLYGWNFSLLEKSLRSLVLTLPYNGHLDITFTNYSSKVYIRPSNRLSRMLSNKWLKFLSIILLIYPFIWLFKRFHRKGGGVWEVCGGAYPLKEWVPIGVEEVIPADLQNVQREESLPAYDSVETSWSSPTLTRGSWGLNPVAMTVSSSHVDNSHPRSARYMQTTSGMKKLVGIKEGEWFGQWEGLIIRAVMGRYRSNEPLTSATLMSPRELDGYNETASRRMIVV